MPTFSDKSELLRDRLGDGAKLQSNKVLRGTYWIHLTDTSIPITFDEAYKDKVDEILNEFGQI